MRQRSLGVTGPLQQVRADRVEALVTGQPSVELVEERQAGGGPVGHGRCDGPVRVTTALPVI